jgi:hypothetical protein
MAASRCWLTLVCALGVSACQSDDEASGKNKGSETESSDAGNDAAADSKYDEDPIRGVTQAGLAAVWGTGADDVWAVGSEGAIVHWDGKTLKIVASSTSRSLHAISGTGPDDIWAGGEEGTTLHWDGTRFDFVERWEKETFLGITAIAPDNVWIVGVVPVDRMGLVRHFDGESWTAAEVPGAASFWEVWSSSDEDIWFVGTDPMLGGLIYRGNGMDFAPMDFSGKPLRGVWGSSAEDVFVLPYDSAPQHWDGESFAEQGEYEEMPVGMLGTWGSAPDDVWAVGLHGRIKHFDGESWSVAEPLIDEPLWAVWGAASDDVWVVGGEGTILRWNGDHWRIFATGADAADAAVLETMP